MSHYENMFVAEASLIGRVITDPRECEDVFYFISGYTSVYQYLSYMLFYVEKVSFCLSIW